MSSSNSSDSGAMRAFLPGLVLGLVVGLGIGAFALPFFEGGRAPSVASADTSSDGGASRESRPRDGVGEDPLGYDERAGDTEPQLTPEQISEALSEYRERHGLEGDADGEGSGDDAGNGDGGE